MGEDEDKAGNPTLNSIRKVEQFIEENGSEEDPVFVNDLHGEIGISFRNIKAAAQFLDEKNVLNSKDSRRGTRTHTAFYC